MQQPVREADFQAACQWWNDLPNTWTPIGWPDHLFRFSVFWNGMILAQPALNRRTKAYAGEGVQVQVVPAVTLAWAERSTWRRSHFHGDDGMVRQGWESGEAPVLWSEWSSDGALLRQHVFAHIPGGGVVVRGDEPLFAWVRLGIHDLCRALPLEPHHGFLLSLTAPHLHTSMEMRRNIVFDANREQVVYPRALRPGSAAGTARRPWFLREPDGRVRLAIAAGQNCALAWRPSDEKHADAWLHVQMPARKGAHVDVLLPMVPVSRRVMDRELALGYDGARREAERFWRRRPSTAARVRVPEPFLNEAARRSLQFARILAERNPATGRDCLVSGSYTYSDLWTTPMAMATAMLLDLLGEHAFVGRHLEIFRAEQGTVTPPGDAYRLHPGFLSTPALYKSIDWVTDNGAILYALAAHGLISGDRAFAARFSETIVRSCEWIRDARALRGHGGVEGILPPAVATDRKTQIQAVWSDGWNYKGLVTAVRLLRQIRHPRAEEFAREAEDYRRAFLAAFRAKCRQMPAWTDARGRKHPFVPTALHGDSRDESRHAFYLDAGALFLVFAGLVPASDPLMKSLCLWFREGPAQAFCRHDANCWQVPVLDHEMSSCEPCYSWNLFHTLALGDRARFLEGLYSLFAGSLSRQTFISCETRGGITGTIFSAPLAIYLARLAVLDEQFEDGALHLLRLVPQAWLRRDQETVFAKMPTEYGPVTLRWKVSSDGRTLNLCFAPRFRSPRPRVVLHLPRFAGIRAVRLTGRVDDVR